MNKHKEMKMYIDLLLVILFMAKTISGLACYSGQAVLGYPQASKLPVHRTTCEPPTDICVTIKYNITYLIDELSVKNVVSIQGVCGLSNLGCDSICSKLLESKKLSSQLIPDCTEECCTEDYCNADLGEFESNNDEILSLNEFRNDANKIINGNKPDSDWRSSDVSLSMDLLTFLTTNIIAYFIQGFVS